VPLLQEEFQQPKLTFHSDLRRRAASRRALPYTSSSRYSCCCCCYYYYYYYYINTTIIILAESVKRCVSEVRYKCANFRVEPRTDGGITNRHTFSTARLRLSWGFLRNDVIRGDDVIRRGLRRDGVDCWCRGCRDAHRTRDHIDHGGDLRQTTNIQEWQDCTHVAWYIIPNY